MNYHEIEKCSISNGIGFRTVLYVSGCSLRCKGCFNSETWDKNSGKKFGKRAKQELFESLNHPYVRGITFSGGHPLEPYNVNDIADLMKEIKICFPEKDIWVYTGMTMSEITSQDLQDLCVLGFYKYDKVLQYADVIVDGPFIESKKDITLKFRGSSNQNIWVKNDDGEWVNTTASDNN